MNTVKSVATSILDIYPPQKKPSSNLEQKENWLSVNSNLWENLEVTNNWNHPKEFKEIAVRMKKEGLFSKTTAPVDIVNSIVKICRRLKK